MTVRRGWVAVPDGWTRDAARGPWPFVTRERLRTTVGEVVTWSSRAHRKQDPEKAALGSTWWAPRAIGWWIGVLFAVGSTCFALGALPPYLSAVGTQTDNATYFVGSLFFTSAAFLQYREAAMARRTVAGEGDRRRRSWWRVLQWQPTRIDWWATLVQFVGTLLFNASTFAALRQSFFLGTPTGRVWVPDALGSVCFLVASTLAWGEAGDAWWSWRPRSLGWWVAAANLVGSVAFGVSAVGAYTNPTTGEVASLQMATLGTFVGAICFFVGAALLLPERTAQPDTGR